MTEPTTSTPETGDATPGAPAKKPRVRRTGTSIDRALALVRTRPDIARRAVETMGFANPIEAEDANLRAVERQCAERLANARAARDFAREIAGLDATARAMLRVGIEDLTKQPGA